MKTTCYKVTAYYKGCKVFKSKFQQQDFNIRDKNKGNNNETNSTTSLRREIPDGFSRTYSTVTKTESVLENKVNELIQNQNTVNSQLTDKLVNS
jgi:hypothetical protein